MIKLGVTGSRDYPDRLQVEATIKNLEGDWTIISGACKDSPDVWAVDVAKGMTLPYIEYPALWRVNGVLNKRAGFERNGLIVDSSDIVIAFWDQKSMGCLDTIKKAISAHKPLMVLVPGDSPCSCAELLDRLAGK